MDKLHEGIMTTKSGITVSLDKTSFDITAKFVTPLEAKLSSIPEPALSPTDLVSRGKKEPRPPLSGASHPRERRKKGMN